MKNHLKITRHNNQVYRKQNENLTAKITELEDQLQESTLEIKIGQADIILLKKEHEETRNQNEELALKIKSLEGDLQESKTRFKNETMEKDLIKTKFENLKSENTNLAMKFDEAEEKLEAEKEKRLQCQEDRLKCVAEDRSKEKIIEAHKSNHSEITTELLTVKEELVIAKKELDEYKKELEDQIQTTKIIHSEKSNLTALLQNSKSEAEYCRKELEDEILKNQNLQAQKSNITMSLEKSKLKALVNQKQTEDCLKNLEDKTEENRNLRASDAEKRAEIVELKTSLKNNLVWSEWSDCSNTCYRTKTRINKCDNSQRQTKACSQDSSICSKSGNYFLIINFLYNFIKRNFCF